jgi:hypothetical protein
MVGRWQESLGATAFGPEDCFYQDAIPGRRQLLREAVVTPWLAEWGAEGVRI